MEYNWIPESTYWFAETQIHFVNRFDSTQMLDLVRIASYDSCAQKWWPLDQMEYHGGWSRAERQQVLGGQNAGSSYGCAPQKDRMIGL